MTIAKFSHFVIFQSIVCVLIAGCELVSPGVTKPAAGSPYAAPKVVGKITAADITESSGIAASRCNSGVLWTHNDSGDDAFIFAINVKGEVLGTWKVQQASNIDWEDIAAFKDNAGKCWLYIGEIGDNKTKRPEHAVYRVPEPRVTGETRSTKKDPLVAQGAESLKFSYPDYDQDAETLMVQPKSGDIYVLTKRVSGPSGVYRIKANFGIAQAQKAQHVADVSVPSIPNGLLTGGDISPDGQRVILCDYAQAYELALPAGSQNFDDVWKSPPVSVELGKRENGESVCYSVDGSSIFATSERKNSPVIEVKRK